MTQITNLLDRLAEERKGVQSWVEFHEKELAGYRKTLSNLDKDIGFLTDIEIDLSDS